MCGGVESADRAASEGIGGWIIIGLGILFFTIMFIASIVQIVQEHRTVNFY